MSIDAVSMLPSYAAELKAMHRAHQPELLRLVNCIPIPAPCRVLDLACGDGYFTRLLSERNLNGETIGVDNSSAYLQEAQRLSGNNGHLQFQQADAYKLPFPDDSFDLVWCGHSLHSLAYTHQLLCEVRRVLRPGGILALVETDSLHHIILPWPVDMELAVHRAEHKWAGAQRGNRRRKYFSRWCSGLLQHAGLQLVQRRTIPVDRCAPLCEADHEFLARHLDDLWKRLGRLINQRYRERLKEYVVPEGEHYLPDAEDLVFTVLNTLVVASTQEA